MPVMAQAQNVPFPESPRGGIFGLRAFTGKQPTNLGVHNGKLAPCPDTPNCVSSQSQDETHAIAPLTFNTNPDKAFTDLKSLVQGIDRTRIVSEAKDYFYAEFTSKILGFVDDVEFYLDRDKNMIHTRSASRLGEGDFGVNHQRIETIRAELQKLESNA